MFDQNEDKKLDWMYKSATTLVDREEYLLGRSVDKTLEQLNTEEKQKQLGTIPPPKNHVEHECIPPSIRDYKLQQQLAEQVDLQAKLQEDPLLAIKKREEETRRQFLQNPVQLAKLQKALSKQQKKSKKNRKYLDDKLIEKLQVLKDNSMGIGSEHQSKKYKKENDLDIILMHKFNALKSKLTEKDLQDIMQGKFTDTESSDSDEDGHIKRNKKLRDDSSDYNKKKSKKRKKKKKVRSDSSDDDRKKSKKKKDDCSDDEKRTNKKKKRKKVESSSSSSSSSSSDDTDSDSSSVEDVRKKRVKKIKKERKDKKKYDDSSDDEKPKKKLKKKRKDKNLSKKFSDDSNEDSAKDTRKLKKNRGELKSKDHSILKTGKYQSNDYGKINKKSKLNNHVESSENSSEEDKKGNKISGYGRNKYESSDKYSRDTSRRDKYVHRRENRIKRERSNGDRTTENEKRYRRRSISNESTNRSSKSSSIERFNKNKNVTRHIEKNKKGEIEHRRNSRSKKSESITRTRKCSRENSNEKQKEHRHKTNDASVEISSGKRNRSKNQKNGCISNRDGHKSRKFETPDKERQSKRDSSDSGSDSDKPKRTLGPQRPPNDSNSDDEVPKIQNWGLVKSDGTKIPLSSNRTNPKPEKPTLIQETKKEEPVRRKKLTDEEKDRLRKEMMNNASWRDEQRVQNIKKFKEIDAKDECKVFDPDFVHKELLKSANSSTVESRIKANLNNIQRSGRDMNSHFSRR